MMTTLDALRRGDLAGARELRIGGGLSEFPREILDLAETLEVLDLSGNALSSLPDDIGRLRHLKALFCSGNRFDRLPPSLGDCVALSQVGFRGAGLREVPTESLPLSLRWLTLTDNRLDRLPDALGQRPLLQKLMLAGNRLRHLPESLAGASNLELLRLSANGFETLPAWLTTLPRLAWLAWAGNPFDRHDHAPSSPTVHWSELHLGSLLGDGASGWVYQAQWRSAAGQDPRSIALKLFKGAMTSDGLPEREMAACLAADAHPNLMSAIGRLTGHPDGLSGLLMPLLPDHWRVLAGPPSRESCSRDVYEPTLRLDLTVALSIAGSIGKAAAHLHKSGLSHGDLYAHNTLWDGTDGAAVLSDFGAAAFLPDTASSVALQKIEVRAWGLLLGELLDRCVEPLAENSDLRALQRHCTQPEPSLRPLLVDALAMHSGLG